MATRIREFLGHFGARKDHAHKKPVVRSSGAEKDHAHDHAHEEPVVRSEEGGFRMKVAVESETPIHVPVVRRIDHGSGGVQGLKWYAEKLQVDDDGDVAQEFLSEVIPDCTHAHHQRRLQSVAQTKPAVLKGPVCTQDGNVHQIVESSSRNPSA